MYAKIKIYSKEEDEHFSFITPEAFRSLDNWMKYRKDRGENVNENSWIMRNLWDVTTTTERKRCCNSSKETKINRR